VLLLSALPSVFLLVLLGDVVRVSTLWRTDAGPPLLAESSFVISLSA
jgi:hypothetical protein